MVIETSPVSKVINTLQETYTTVPPLILQSSALKIPPQIIGSGLSLLNAFQSEKMFLKNELFKSKTYFNYQYLTYR